MISELTVLLKTVGLEDIASTIPLTDAGGSDKAGLECLAQSEFSPRDRKTFEKWLPER